MRGIHDMTGNVSEWCRDTYRKHEYVIRKRENLLDPFNEKEPPAGTFKTSTRVWRGSAFCRGLKVGHPGARHDDDPDYSSSFRGFRCVREGP